MFLLKPTHSKTNKNNKKMGYRTLYHFFVFLYLFTMC
jgi:hypothetical protein